MTFRSGYDIPEAVRKVAVATAFRALFLKDKERPNYDEKKLGLAIAVALYFDLNETEIRSFIENLTGYVQLRKEDTIFRDPSLYE